MILGFCESLGTTLPIQQAGTQPPLLPPNATSMGKLPLCVGSGKGRCLQEHGFSPLLSSGLWLCPCTADPGPRRAGMGQTSPLGSSWDHPSVLGGLKNIQSVSGHGLGATTNSPAGSQLFCAILH